MVRGQKGEHKVVLQAARNAGYREVRFDGTLVDIDEMLRTRIDKTQEHTIEVVVTKLDQNTSMVLESLLETVKQALELGNGLVMALVEETTEDLLFSQSLFCAHCNLSLPSLEPRLFSFNSPYGACQTCHGLGTKELFSEEMCVACEGKRLRKEALHIFIGGKNIVDVTRLSVREAADYFLGVNLEKNEAMIAEPVLREMIARVSFLLDVGLEYLSLNRTAGTLSGGEAQRIRLASQIGSRLVGTLYILDEPTIGLHQRDNRRLIDTLLKLRDLGNTIIVVEHDEDTIAAADYLVDIGPGAGVHGGEIVAAGAMPKILSNEKSLTCAYLRGDKHIPMPAKRRPLAKEWLVVKQAEENNLQKITAQIPLKRFVCVTGVSGGCRVSFASCQECFQPG
jgi:excinuclease ABC subunit A